MDPQFQDGAQVRTERLSQWFFIIAVFLLPIAVVPISWFPFALLKASILTVLLLLAIVSFSIFAYTRGGYSLPRGYLVWAILALPVVYALSSFFSQNPVLSYMGTGGEVSTLFFMSLCALIALAGGLLVSTKRSVTTALLALFCALAIVAVFQVLEIFFGPGIFGLSAFSSLSSNLVGKWNDFGLLMGLLTVLSIGAIDLIRPKSHVLVVCLIAAFVSVCLLVMVNLDVLWWALAGVALLICLMTLFGRDAYVDPLLPRVRKAPYASVVVLIISIVFVVWGNQISALVQTVAPISEMEIRPAFSTTVDILKGTYSQSLRTALLGTGPGTFNEQWLIYKPAEVNATQFWNLDFVGGSGAIPTAFITTGLLGGIVWVVIILLLLAILIRATRTPHPDPAIRSALLLCGLGALFLLIGSALYLSGQVPLLVAFILLALLLASVRMSSPHERILHVRNARPVAVGAGAGLLLVLILASVGVTALSLQRFTASWYVGRALSVSAGDFTGAEMYATKALQLYSSDETLKLLSNIKLAQAQAISNEDSAQNTDQAQRFQTVFGDAVKYGQRAIAADPRDYQNYVHVAQLFEALVPLNVTGAYDNAKQQYMSAIEHNASNPGLYLALARLEAQAGNMENFTQAMQKAFALKQNYTEAALLVLQVEVARNNVDGAIIAAEVAAQTAPQNPGIFFQLGLLKYAKGDGNGAREAFERALMLQSDYANAKYFLGLTYQRLQRTQEAIELFRDLRKTNPDNEEVGLILNNLQTGKDPFASSTPPITPNPETRDTAPINE